jgi:hypothetical protein
MWSMNIPDQVDHHFNAIFAGWMAAFIAACITALHTRRHWLRLACNGIGAALLAAPLVYLAGLLLAFLISH